ncbi:glycosyltransferase family 2 protein [Celeribacter baekdonensis]|uniref:Glycosyl transferase family 2 n=1 Tax=Celeribacter baekdonensis TaxID=875171 RepID=A0A2R4M4N1_9RHOB|nr:glycosyltransferase family 2 protein [Celeribacter baekdonensis]AVW92078.1 hypothetical protein DA792_14135 [Celeribacter baekdonensis]
MTHGEPSWAIAALADEPAPLIAAFARHHLAIGAREVHIFLDRPNPEAEALLHGLEGCILATCDQTYWDKVNNGRRPERHTGRQKFNATRVYQTTKCDWLLHCDVDEFIADGAALSSLLNRKESAHGLVLRNRERVHLETEPGETIFEGAFRDPIGLTESDAKALYGRFAKFLDFGLTGHRTGKTIVPTGRDWTMGVHYPIGADMAKMIKSETRLLLHFDGLTELHYALKLLKKAFEDYSGPKRQIGQEREAQYRYIRNKADNPKELFRLVHGVQSLNERQATTLGVLGVLHDTAFMPQNCADLDLTTTTFNAMLRAREAALIAKAGLEL